MGDCVGATIEDRILLLLSIKEYDKKIDLPHILEKISRDIKIPYSKPTLKSELETMTGMGMVRSSGNFYYITEKGLETIKGRLAEVGDELNLSYRMVLKAKKYYEATSEFILPFLRGRPITLVKIFSDDLDPIRKIKPLFVRYSRYKPIPEFIRISSEADLKRYVDDHALDYIPYVHPFESKEPDWFVIDLDAGEHLRTEKGFHAVKYAASQIADLLHENDIFYAVKFSGSRGMQIWSSLDNEKMPKGDIFTTYRALIQSIQSVIDERIKFSRVPADLKELAENGMTTSTVAKKAERAEKVLVDWSSMKLFGDVRAPFSIHYKTQLVSCPVDPSRIMEFDSAQSEPETVEKNAWRLSKYFDLTASNPAKLLRSFKM